MPGDGTLTLIVWPTHVGVATEAGEPGTSADYERGQVDWQPDINGEIIGRALINVPAGEYTHLVYFHCPLGGRHSTIKQMEHPLRMPTTGVVEIYPIVNGDQLGNILSEC